MSIQSQLEHSLVARSQKTLIRQRKVRHSPVGPWVDVAGETLLNFASNDYLGLANHPRVVTAFKQAVDRYGVGSGASSVVSGYTTAHQALEEALADFLGYPRTLVFSTGYMANVGILTVLSAHLSVILQDKLNHASLTDGGIFSKIAFERYAHQSMKDLSRRLEKYQTAQGLVVSDGVFSVQGDVCALPELSQITRQTSNLLMIDDAHAIGVLGTNGRGTLEHFHLSSSAVDILVGTFGKAFGTFGAFVAADDLTIETLLQSARSYIYTTALPPAIAAATLESLTLIQTEFWRRETLSELIRYFQKGLVDLSLPSIPIGHITSMTPIQCIPIGSATTALQMGEKLAKEGIFVAVMRPPSTMPNKSCLRITLTAAHQKSHIDQLLSAFAKVIEIV